MSLSTTTKIASLLKDLGNPVIKSSDMSLNGVTGISKG
jgi:hypothetical protein